MHQHKVKNKQKETVGIFAKQIEELWQKAFSTEHVVLKYAIKQRLDTHLMGYQCQVTKNGRVSKRMVESLKEMHTENGKAKTISFLIC